MSTLKPSEELVFVAAKRTPFGAFGGSLAAWTATDLAEAASRAALEQAGIRGEDIDATVFGNVAQTAADAIYLARHVGLRVGLPLDRPALTVNRLCGSGFEAIVQGAYLLREEGARAVLVGGTESMSQSPYVLRGARFGYRMGHGELEDSMSASLTDAHVKMPMAITAENLATKHGFDRATCDAYALSSQQRATEAWASGVYANEVAPIKLKSKKGETLFERDEHMRPDSSLAGLAKLSPVFKKDGVVTAGNASGITDGACALVLTTASHAKARGWKPLGRLVTWAFVGCDPTIMGIGPVPATLKALERWSTLSGSKKTVDDFSLVEINEAFAPQYLAVERELGLKRERTNIHGGAIAVGHPLAASGARLVSHLLYHAPVGKAALASACIGGGQGMSVIVERI